MGLNICAPSSFKFIVAIVRVASIRRGAVAISITYSALNRQLLAFEGELGVKIAYVAADGTVSITDHD